MDDAFDHHYPVAKREKYQIIAMHCLPQTWRQVVTPGIGTGPGSNTAAAVKQFVDKGNSARRVVGRDVVANSFQVLERFRPQPVAAHRLPPSAIA